METVKWYCRGCSASCKILVDGTFDPRSCIYSDTLKAAWYKDYTVPGEISAKTASKMDKVLKLYPNCCEWQFRLDYERDASGDVVPKISVGFGKVCEVKGFSSLILDKEGAVMGFDHHFDKLPEGAFETFEFSYDDSFDRVANSICDEILKRKQK